MTYNAIEISTELAEPAELFEFNYGSNYYRYTSSMVPVVYAGQTFEPMNIKRSSISNTANPNAGALTITTFRSNPVAGLFRFQPPSAVVHVTIRRRHLTDTGAEFIVVWIGRILSAGFFGNEAKLSCEPLFVSLKRTGLRLHYQAGCPHALYGNGCNLLPSAFRVTSVSFSADGTTVFASEISSEPDNFYAGGYIEYVSIETGDIEQRQILSSSAGNLEVSLPPVGLNGAAELFIHPGCNHTLEDCVTKFNNLLNYGGHPFIPSKNPFGGTRIF
jgi:hypothetical protein